MPRSLIASLLALPLIALTCGHTTTGEEALADRQEPPRVKLIVSGHLEGHLEPCGCASGQVGGLARRAFRIQQDHDHDLLIEGGGLTVGGTALDELKLFTILNVLDDTKARYDAIGIGPGDLRLGVELLSSYLEAFPQLHFLSADLTPREGTTWAAAPSTETTARSGVKVRIAGLTMALPEGDDAVAQALELRPPQPAWSAAMADADPDTLRILIAHGGMNAVRELARLTPRPDLVIAANDASIEPLREPEFVDGVPIVHPGTRGRFLLELTLARVAGEPKVLAHDAIALHGSRTAKGALEDPSTRELVLQHRFEVRDDGTLQKLAGRLPTPNGASYIGSAACSSCHTSAWESWQASKHAQAWETLEQAESSDRYGWPVTRYPDCVACHTVGYGEQTGFVDPETTPLLEDVGCEECHGPASAHAEDPEANRLGKVAPTTCTRCHDFEQSPDFDYQQRWQRIEHR